MAVTEAVKKMLNHRPIFLVDPLILSKDLMSHILEACHSFKTGERVPAVPALLDD